MPSEILSARASCFGAAGRGWASASVAIADHAWTDPEQWRAGAVRRGILRRREFWDGTLIPGFHRRQGENAAVAPSPHLCPRPTPGPPWRSTMRLTMGRPMPVSLKLSARNAGAGRRRTACPRTSCRNRSVVLDPIGVFRAFRRAPRLNHRFGAMSREI